MSKCAICRNKDLRPGSKLTACDNCRQVLHIKIRQPPDRVLTWQDQTRVRLARQEVLADKHTFAEDASVLRMKTDKSIKQAERLAAALTKRVRANGN